jgi:serine/threonine protein kinase
MHRDIKSLNIFMSTGLVPRVADFGMATSELTGKEACGTVQVLLLCYSHALS